jgi:hypothetical protein
MLYPVPFARAEFELTTLLVIGADCIGNYATNTNLVIFGLTRPGLEPTIYRTRGEHGNHYVTDAVL